MALIPHLFNIFFSHILHGVCLQSQFPSHSECGILSLHFENNAHLYFHSLYEFLLSADLSFPFLREIVTALGVPPDVVSASRSSLDLLNIIEFFRDGFASCLTFPQFFVLYMTFLFSLSCSIAISITFLRPTSQELIYKVP